jgi:hypothetical protein
MRMHAVLGAALWCLGLVGCTARAEPLDAEVVVTAHGEASPVRTGTRCQLRMRPAWRQGVNCQVLLRCGTEDLFGGRRIGGYAKCDFEDHHFTRALDRERRTDGDPALDLDLQTGILRWEGPNLAETAVLSVVGTALPGSLEWPGDNDPRQNQNGAVATSNPMNAATPAAANAPVPLRR